jgi:hypothetical protein
VPASALLPEFHATAADPAAPKNLAAVVTVYTHNSHADVIAGRLLETTTLDGKGRRPNLKLVSLYLDQIPEKDKGRRLAAEHGVDDTARELKSLLWRDRRCPQRGDGHPSTSNSAPE